MELIVKDINIPDKIDFNYEELKSQIQEKTQIYNNLVYQDKDLKIAKSDKSNLNKLKKALNDERIRREREYMQPFNEFKEKINEIIKIIDEPINIIDKQVKEFEKVKKENKRKQINELFSELNPYKWLKIDKIYNSKWLNSSFAIKKVQDEMNLSFNDIENDLNLIKTLDNSFEIEEFYKKSLDINYAISEMQKIKNLQKQKEEQEKKLKEEAIKVDNGSQIKQNEQIEINFQEQNVAKEWISFTALLSIDEALKLKQFFAENNIQFKPLEEK